MPSSPHSGRRNLFRALSFSDLRQKFGRAYAEYMKSTKMIIPYVY